VKDLITSFNPRTITLIKYINKVMIEMLSAGFNNPIKFLDNSCCPVKKWESTIVLDRKLTCLIGPFVKEALCFSTRKGILAQVLKT
jgi:hypothetical protein